MIWPAAAIERVLLAGGAGDCIGGPGEGTAGASGAPPPPWRISDDTSLTLATCRAIVDAGAVDPASIAAALVAEYRTGTLRGAGASTLKALSDLAAGVHWAAAGRVGEFAAGNGAAMRIGPLAFFLSGESPGDRQRIRDVCRITHRNDEAYVAALAVVRAMRSPGSSELSSLAEDLPDTRVRDALLALSALPADCALRQAVATSGNSGHAAESVPLAIYLATRFTACATVILAAVECGGDTDTIASLAGQIAAARGAAIPDEWLPHIPHRAEIQTLSVALAAIAR